MVVAAPEIGVPNGKSLYSSRPNRTLQPRSEATPTLAPTADQTVVRPNPMMPIPVVPAQPNMSTPDSFLENKTFSNQSSLDFSSTVPAIPNRSNKPSSSQGLVIEKPAEVRPLSKIDVNPMSNIKSGRTEIDKKTEESSSSNFTSPAIFPNQSVLAENNKNHQEDQLDELNARLAKIQLEKHNLNETLKLIGKIKSPVIKAKTLVDLAEYVSRDNNYKKEADQLFALAVDGIDALTKGEAIVIKIKDDLKTETTPSSSSITNTKISGSAISAPQKPTESISTTSSVVPSTSSTSTSSAPPRRTGIKLLDEDEPVDLSSSKTESTSTTTIQKPNESSAISAPSAVLSTPSTSTKKIPMSLDDEPKPTLEEKNNDTKKDSTSSVVPNKRPTILSNDEPETSQSKTTTEEKPAETKTPPRRPILLLTEETDININKDKESKTKFAEPIKTETIKKEEPETIKSPEMPSSNSTLKRKAMPGRSKVTLEEN
jgi:hypothetical protein